MSESRPVTDKYFNGGEQYEPIVITTDSGARSEAPVVKLLDQIIGLALQQQASDIHLEPQEDRLRVRLRVDGFLLNLMDLPRSLNQPLISRIKVMAGMDIAEKRKPLDGRIKLELKGKKVDLRIATLPTVCGEKIVIRLLEHSLLQVGLANLGLDQAEQQSLQRLLKIDHGLLIFTGPTGSGKSTSLYSVVQEINDVTKNIVTIEDPVEYLLPGISQMAVNVKVGLSFPDCLRSVLRQDPDVIMIGEIRDEETASLAIRSALTGHLVLTTLHTNDAAGAVVRLLDMGVKPYLLASALTAVIGQRLVRLICPKCRQKHLLSESADENAVREFLGLGVGQPARVQPAAGQPVEPPLELCQGKGCAGCGHTGFKGRTGLFEILTVSAEISSLIKRQAATDEIEAQALNEGMRTIYQAGIGKVLRGETTLAELLRLLGAQDMLRKRSEGNYADILL